MSNSQYLILDDGSVFYISTIVKETSFDLYQTNLHYQICQRMAKAIAEDTDEEKFLTNLFSLKSSLARVATALSYFIDLNKEKINEIVINSKLKELLEPSLIGDIKCTIDVESHQKNLTFSNVIKLVIKAVCHRIFRLLETDKNSSDIIVRGWVDVTVRLFPEELNKGLLCIYPFALGVRRQIKFIHSCSKKNVRYTLTGMPYSIKSIVRDIIIGKPPEKIIFNAEKAANKRHARELLKRSPKQIFTSDEYETGVFFLYRDLIMSQVTVVNSAHGVGQYCPYLCYSKFKVLSESQSKFYELFNEEINYELVTQDHSTIPLDWYLDCLDKKLAIVLIHQPFKESNLDAEDNALHSLDRQLTHIANRLNLPYFIKMHPNYRKSTIGGGNNFTGKNVLDWGVLNNFRLIFITINSSVYFELRGRGVILVYNAPTFSPALYFPDQFLTISSATVESRISTLIEPASWADAAAKHAETYYSSSQC